jgi:hypothetical protein
VATRKSIAAWSYFSMERSSEPCTSQHVPAQHPVGSRPCFRSIFSCYFHRLQLYKRCSHIWVTILPALPHCQRLSLSQCLNHFCFLPTGVCLDICQSNQAGRGFTRCIVMGLMLQLLTFSLSQWCLLYLWPSHSTFTAIFESKTQLVLLPAEVYTYSHTVPVLQPSHARLLWRCASQPLWIPVCIGTSVSDGYGPSLRVWVLVQTDPFRSLPSG